MFVTWPFTHGAPESPPPELLLETLPELLPEPPPDPPSATAPEPLPDPPLEPARVPELLAEMLPELLPERAPEPLPGAVCIAPPDPLPVLPPELPPGDTAPKPPAPPEPPSLVPPKFSVLLGLEEDPHPPAASDIPKSRPKKPYAADRIEADLLLRNQQARERRTLPAAPRHATWFGGQSSTSRGHPGTHLAAVGHRRSRAPPRLTSPDRSPA